MAHQSRLGQRVVGVPGQDDVDPGGKLPVDIEAVVTEQHHQPGTVRACVLDQGCQTLLADAKRPGRKHPAGVGDRGVGKVLADHRDVDPAALEASNLVKGRFLPIGIAHIGAEKRELELFDPLLDPLLAERELLMAGHGVGPEQRHGLDHVLTAGLQRRPRPLPGIAPV